MGHVFFLAMELHMCQWYTSRNALHDLHCEKGPCTWPIGRSATARSLKLGQSSEATDMGLKTKLQQTGI